MVDEASRDSRRARGAALGLCLAASGCQRSAAAAADGGAAGATGAALTASSKGHADSGVVIAFESGLRAQGGMDVKAIDDTPMGGVSHVELSIDPAGASGTAHALRLRGTSTRDAFPFPFAGVAIPLGPKDGDAPAPMDLRARSGVQMWIKGNGKSYVLRASSTKVRDYDFHHRVFVATPEWTLLRVPFTELEQYTWGKQVPWSDAAASVTSLAVVNDSPPSGTFGPIDLAIDEIEFF